MKLNIFLSSFLFVCSVRFLINAYETTPNPETFPNAIQKPIPQWMSERISKDLEPFKDGITHQMIENALEKYADAHYLLVHFKIKNGKCSYSPKEFWSNGDRAIAYQNAIQYLLDTVGLPDMEFVMSLHDGVGRFMGSPDWWPSPEKSPNNPADLTPLMSYGRNDKDTCSILIPDFIALRGYVYDLGGYGPMHPLWESIKWEDKKDKSFWRGSSTGAFINKDNWNQVPRIKLALLSLKHPDLLDAKITNLVQVVDNAGTIIQDQGLLGGFASFEEQLQYRYLIDVDGNGWTVPHCYWILRSNSLLLKQESDWILWFSDGLVPYVNYIPFSDENDLISKIQWIRTDDILAQTISKNATEFAKNDLSLESTYLYFYHMLTRYAQLLKQN